MSIRDGDDTNGPILVGALLFTHHRRVGDLQDLLTFSHLDHLETNISQVWTPFLSSTILWDMWYTIFHYSVKSHIFILFIFENTFF